MQFLLKFPKSKIISFEPVKENFVILKKNTKKKKNITCFNFAIGERTYKTLIFINKNSQTHSLVRKKKGEYENKKYIKVKSLDFLYSSKIIKSSIDILKIDTEGFELPVLKGAKNLLESGKVKSILAEASLQKNDKCHTNLVKLKNSLEKNGFKLCGIYDQDSNKELKFFNALFVKK